MGLLGLSEETWIIPETFVFLSRIFEILAMCCVLCGGREGGLSFSEWIFILSCAAVFFLNCLEFIGPLKDNLLVQWGAAGVGLAGLGFLFLSSTGGGMTPNLLIREKYYASVFSGMGMTCCLLSGVDFYLHMQSSA